MIDRVFSIFRAFRLGCNLWLRSRRERKQLEMWRIGNE